MTININKVQTCMLNKTQEKPLKKQILSHMQHKWQSQILDFSRNLESYLVLDWISWDRKWVFHRTLSFTYEITFTPHLHLILLFNFLLSFLTHPYLLCPYPNALLVLRKAKIYLCQVDTYKYLSTSNSIRCYKNV